MEGGVAQIRLNKNLFKPGGRGKTGVMKDAGVRKRKGQFTGVKERGKVGKSSALIRGLTCGVWKVRRGGIRLD